MAINRLNTVSVLFAILIGTLIGAYGVIRFRPLPEGKVLANISAIDSLNAFRVFADSIMNLPMEPVVTKTDTFYITEIKYVETTPTTEIDNDDPTITHYHDSLVIVDTINVWVDFMLRDYKEEVKLSWKYTPIIREVETTTEIPIYHPVITEVEVPKYLTGHYLSGEVAGNSNLFTFGVEYSIVREKWIYGIDYRRYNNKAVYGVKIGVNVRSLFDFKP